MLVHLSIQNLAVVEHLELKFDPEMTVLSGETGAGKSILIDALGLTLGERAESGIVRHGCKDADVSAVFELNDLPNVIVWLKENALDAEEECIIRRTLTEDGRSRAFINGKTVPLSQLRELSEQLVNIHGQHQHQTLLKPDHQRTLLDEYANHFLLTERIQKAYTEWQVLRKEHKALLALQGQNDKLTLLKYQVQEMDELNLQANEWESLEAEHKQLTHAEHWLSICQNALLSLKNERGEAGGLDATSLLAQAMHPLAELKNQAPKLKEYYELLNSAKIQLQEAVIELQGFMDSIHLDPSRLSVVEQRISQIHTLSRKHRIQPESILAHAKQLKLEAKQLEDLQINLDSIGSKLKEAEVYYSEVAKELSLSRQKSAKLLEKLVKNTLQTLEMPNARFEIAFSEENAEKPSMHGLDTIEFLVSTNPGLPLQPLRKIASGGELSRISLAIQVITAQKMTTPTLIFDEVDAGISGKTAETVGKLLRKLSKQTQVLCVTHLPQIAAEGHHHFKVEKQQTKESTTTQIFLLDKAGRVQELARMLGGTHITKHVLLHAEEMLESV